MITFFDTNFLITKPHCGDGSAWPSSISINWKEFLFYLYPLLVNL